MECSICYQELSNQRPLLGHTHKENTHLFCQPCYVQIAQKKGADFCAFCAAKISNFPAEYYTTPLWSRMICVAPYNRNCSPWEQSQIPYRSIRKFLNYDVLHSSYKTICIGAATATASAISRRIFSSHSRLVDGGIGALWSFLVLGWLFSSQASLSQIMQANATIFQGAAWVSLIELLLQDIPESSSVIAIGAMLITLAIPVVSVYYSVSFPNFLHS